MVELRKRPPPKETATPAPNAKRGGSGGGSGSTSTVKKLAEKAKEVVSSKGAADQEKNGGTPSVAAAATAAAGNGSGKIAVGDTIPLDGFGGTVQTHDGTSVTVKELLEKSGKGLVLFTYPKASTPGCKSSLSGFVLLPNCLSFATAFNPFQCMSIVSLPVQTWSLWAKLETWVHLPTIPLENGNCVAGNRD